MPPFTPLYLDSAGIVDIADSDDVRRAVRDHLRIEDFLYRLVNIKRFSGAGLWSVATHSYFMSCVACEQGLPPAAQLECLLHDFAEAYLGDTPLYVRRALASSLLERYHRNLQAAVEVKWGNPFEFPYQEVRDLDNLSARHEAHAAGFEALYEQLPALSEEETPSQSLLDHVEFLSLSPDTLIQAFIDRVEWLYGLTHDQAPRDIFPCLSGPVWGYPETGKWGEAPTDNTFGPEDLAFFMGDEPPRMYTWVASDESVYVGGNPPASDRIFRVNEANPLPAWSPPPHAVTATAPTEGVKYDDSKPDYTLLPWDALEEVVRCLEYGARKYARDNWKKVPDAFDRYERAGFRHRAARVRGEDVDPESGCRHLAHEVCSLLFQMSLRPATAPDKENS